MKNFTIILLFLIWAGNAHTNGVETTVSNNFSETIATALKNSDVKTLVKFLNNTVDITVPDKEGTFSRSQAEFILKDFFTKYKAISFTTNNNGESKGGSIYTIGTLVTEKGTFRTYYLIKKTGEQYTIQQLQFEIQE